MSGLPIVVDDDAHALAARWPEPVLSLSDGERRRRVRAGAESVMLDETDAGARRTRGFVRAVLRVPLGHPRAQAYGVFVEVDRGAYAALRRAHQTGVAARVWGTLATRLPYLEDAYGAAVEIVEDGSELRPRVVDARSALLRQGPPVGPR
ncbi:MAG: hypothetical protein A2138_07070 [Deltaproteobacteria bacterium RBG_16_71_12]|nr:MAG: hypothetical protein A2138_07070 [Deltaproteobacteria bacterium RBG_16_71_12]